MTDDANEQRSRRPRRRRVRTDSSAGEAPSESRGEGSAPASSRRARRPRRRPAGEGEAGSDRQKRPSNNGQREAEPGNSSASGSRRRRRSEPRPAREGIRDTTASRMAAAESTPNRRSRPQRGRSGGGGGRGRQQGNRSGARQQPKRKGLEILRLLQQQVSIDPIERFQLETTPDVTSTRVMDLISPIGRGQRALIVSPPKAGKTTLLIQVAEALHINHPDVKVYALLIDERPEEVTHFRRSTHAEVYAASSDMATRDHINIAEDCMNTVVEPVLAGEDVVLLLDSITRLARAYNNVQGGSGRTLSGGLDAATMLAPRQIFGAARKIEDGGSLTILGTALVDTGSRMDEVIFQEFKGTGNTELVLSRDLFEKRIFPSVDIGKSGTRKEEKLYPDDVVGRLHKLRRLAASYPADQAMLGLLKLMQRHKTNEELLQSLAAME